jgi:purine-binding chemotaxis protein CheW
MATLIPRLPPRDGTPCAPTDWAALHRRLEAARAALERARAPDRDAAERVLKARARALASPVASEPTQDSIEVLEFRIGGETWAIEPRHVREVLPLETLVPLPGVATLVRGIATVRGEILSVIDLRRLFGLPERGLGELDYAVVLHSPSMSFAILADAIVGLRQLPISALQASLPTLDGVRAEYLLGISRERTVVLDGDRLLVDGKRLAAERDAGLEDTA